MRRRKGWSGHMRKSVFKKMLLSNVVILLIPVLFGYFIYSKMENEIVDHVHRSHSALLKQVQQAMNQQVKEVDQLMIQISSDPKLQILLERTLEEHQSNLYAFIDFMKVLGRYQTASSSIDDFFVYLDESGTILSPSMKTNSDMYFSHIQPYQDMKEQTVRNELLTGYHSREYWPSHPIGKGSRKRNMITYVQSLPVGERNQVKGSLVILIDEQKIRDMINQIGGLSNGSIYILDEQQQIMISSEENETLIQEVKGDIKTNDYGLIDLSDKDMILSYTTSSENGWTYVSVVPKEVVMSSIHELKASLMTLVLLCLVAGLIASYLIAYNNYSPIKDVVNAIYNFKPLSKPNRSNEFEFIKKMMSNTFQQESQLRNTLSKQLPVIRYNFLFRLLKGQVNMQDVSVAYLHRIGIRLVSDQFYVLLVDLNDENDINAANTEVEWSLLHFAITNASDELLKEHGYVIEMERTQLAVLINPSASSTDTGETLLASYIEQLKKMLAAVFHTQVTIAISQCHQGLENASQCYTEAVMAMDYKMIKGHYSVIHYDEIRTLNENRYEYHFPYETEVQLINYVKSGDIPNVEKLIDQIFEVNFNSGTITPGMGKCLSLDFISSILKIIHSMQLEAEKIFEAEVDIADYFSENRTAAQMQVAIKKLYCKLCHEITAGKTDRKQELLDNITKYIQQHYNESTLSLTSIAEHFNLNASYLSAFFKKYSGQNITDYIVGCRIEHTKKLLQNESLTITQIANRVGYANSVGLIRVFKKLEGITPGKYRQMIDK